MVTNELKSDVYDAILSAHWLESRTGNIQKMQKLEALRSLMDLHFSAVDALVADKAALVAALVEARAALRNATTGFGAGGGSRYSGSGGGGSSSTSSKSGCVAGGGGSTGLPYADAHSALVAVDAALSSVGAA